MLSICRWTLIGQKLKTTLNLNQKVEEVVSEFSINIQTLLTRCSIKHWWRKSPPSWFLQSFKIGGMNPLTFKIGRRNPLTFKIGVSLSCFQIGRFSERRSNPSLGFDHLHCWSHPGHQAARVRQEIVNIKITIVIITVSATNNYILQLLHIFSWCHPF